MQAFLFFLDINVDAHGYVRFTYIPKYFFKLASIPELAGYDLMTHHSAGSDDTNRQRLVQIFFRVFHSFKTFNRKVKKKPVRAIFFTLKSSKTANANILVQKGVHGWPV
jgi:hypothetical protein